VRIDVSTTPNGTYISAYKNSSTNDYAIVAINYNSQATSVQFSASGFSFGSVTPYRTSSTEDLAVLNATTLTSPVSLAASSVTTVVGNSSLIGPCMISPTSLPSYVAGQTVNQQFTASGCNPSSYTISSGSLSGSGLALSSTGLLNGTATAGTFNFTVAYAGATDPLTLTISTASFSPCDVNHDGLTNSTDVNLEIQSALGSAACTNDVNKDGVCNVLDVQLIINAAVGGACVSP
jgi:hypothetical protein